MKRLTQTDQGSTKIINVATPTSGNDAANKTYVDGKKLPSYVVDVNGTGDYTDIQSAIDALSGGSGKIIVKAGVYTITSGLLLKGSYQIIEGMGPNATRIDFDGSTVTTAINPNAGGYIGLQLHNLRFNQTNATVQGTGLDASNTAICYYSNLRFDACGTAVAMSDTGNQTYYNTFHNIRANGCNNGVIVNGTNPTNMHLFEGLRIGNLDVSGYGMQLNNAEGIALVSCDFEPSAGGTSQTGLSIGATSHEISVQGGWIEGNHTGVQIVSGAYNVTFIGTQLYNTGTGVTEISDSGTEISWVGCRTSAGTYNQTSANIIAKRTASTISISAYDTGGTNRIWMYHTGTYGQIESTTGFVLASDSGGTAVTGTVNPELRVQYAGGGFNSVTVHHDDTNGTIATSAGALILSPATNVRIPSGAGASKVLTSDGSGNATWQSPTTGLNRSINSISTPTSAGATAATDYVYLVSGTTTLTLPTAVGNTNLYTVKNTGSNTVTIATTSSQTIDGSTTIPLPVASQAVDLISDNSNWRVM